MAPLLGFETLYMPLPQTARWLRPFQYVQFALRTVAVLKRKCPAVIWVQLPQVPLLTAALWYKKYGHHDVRIIADCHNRILNSPWNRWPGLRKQLNSCDVVLVHNNAVIQKVTDLGVDPRLIRILEDPPATLGPQPGALHLYPRPWVLFLASFNPDEPIKELFEAARLAPDIRFVLAGDSDRASGRHRLDGFPPNVRMPGYLSGEHLDAAISQTDAVLALTKLDDAQLSSAAEAIGAGRPMVLSDTPVTREMYYKGGVFVDTYSPASIVAGCRLAIEQGSKLAAESAALREERLTRWQHQADSIKELLSA